jgi:S-adenosylmethionine:diacylglycerol 3-amino-3-carboxypropyl transferase
MRAPETPWRDAGLMFSHMFEDWTLEARVFAPRGRVFSIASAGCTAIALAARGHDVTAVDVNPAQVAFVRARLQGAPLAEGSVDRFLARARGARRAIGWTEAKLREFLSMDDVGAQHRFWTAHLETRRLKVLLATLLSQAVLQMFYPAPLARAVPRAFASVLRQRLARGFATHVNRTNPYAWLLLLGESTRVAPPAAAGSIRLFQADAAEYLEASSPGSFDAFTLSNILDAADVGYARRLQAAIEHAARPQAVVVMRSFAEPDRPEDDEWARQDRALLWGAITVTHT